MNTLLRTFFLAVAVSLAGGPAHAEALKNPIAIFAGLDKITGQIITFEIGIDETKRFGSLNVRPRVCNSRGVTEEPKTTAFVEVDENLLNGKLRRIFNGWMFAESPGLNAVEHPVYDVWLTGCRDPNRKPEPEFQPQPESSPDASVEPGDESTGETPSQPDQ